MTQPTFTTERLIVRPRDAGDADACYAMNMEPGTLAHIDFPREGSWDDEAAHRAYIAETLAHVCPPGLGYWSVVRRDAPGVFLGWVLLAPEDLKGPEVEIGWRFAGIARGHGYATEAARAVLDHGLSTLGLPAVVAEIWTDNAASLGVARKLGMRPRPGTEADGKVLMEIRPGDTAEGPA